MEMQRRSFLQLLAAIPAFGVTCTALARLAPEAAPSAADFTMFRFGGIEAQVRGIRDLSRVTAIHFTSLDDEFGQQMPREQIAGVELVGLHPFPMEDGPFEIEGAGFLIVGHAELEERRHEVGSHRGDTTILRMRPKTFELTIKNQAA